MFNIFKPKPYIEIARSFSMKKNLGNYETLDLFCSAKRECLPEEADDMSEKLLGFCRREVVKDLNAYLVSISKKDGQPKQGIKTTPKVEAITADEIDFNDI